MLKLSCKVLNEVCEPLIYQIHNFYTFRMNTYTISCVLKTTSNLERTISATFNNRAIWIIHLPPFHTTTDRNSPPTYSQAEYHTDCLGHNTHLALAPDYPIVASWQNPFQVIITTITSSKYERSHRTAPPSPRTGLNRTEIRMDSDDDNNKSGRWTWTMWWGNGRGKLPGWDYYYYCYKSGRRR